MTINESILKFIEKNNGIASSSMLTKEGYSRGNIKYLLDSGKIERSTRGVYILPNNMNDYMYDLQLKYKRGIYSLETALFLCDLTDRTPIKYNMTFPISYNLTNPKNDGILCNSSIEDTYKLGIINVKTPNGNIVNSYSPEKTLCDILKPRNHIDIQIVSEAFKRYVNKTDKDINLLSHYAKILKVDKKVRSYLEVLL